MISMKNNVIWSLLFGGAFFFYGLFTLSHYGLNLDETSHYLRGHMYLHFLLTGERDFVDLPPTYRKSLYQNENTAYKLTFENDSGHPPLNDILAAFFNTVLYQKLGVLPDLEAHHAFTLLVSSLSVVVVVWFVSSNYGLFSGLVAGLAFGLYPLFLGESRFNIKDPVETSFYTLAIIFFYSGVARAKYIFILVSSIFTGLALGTKFNIFFAIPTVGIWILFVRSAFVAFFRRKDKHQLLFSFFIYPFTTFGIFFFTWPFLWNDPIRRILETFNYYQKIGFGIIYQSPEYLTVFGINTYGAQWILFTTPIITLILTFFGIIYVFKKGIFEKNKLSILILIWFLIPIIRASMPKAGIYGGVRQIMEYIPAMAILAGIGANYVIAWLLRYLVTWFKILNIKQTNFKLLLQIVIVLCFFPVAFKIISIHPNENVFMNSIIGGLGGARQRKLDHWGNTFGNVYRQGVVWLNSHAENGAVLVLGGQFDDNILQMWLRPDLIYSNALRSGFARKGEYAIEMTGDNAIMAHLFYFTYLKKFLIPVYEVRVDDVPILTIWKNDLQHTKPEYLGKKQITEFVDHNNVVINDSSLIIKLDRQIVLTGITIKFSSPSCKFTPEGYFRTFDSNAWITHTGNLESLMFFSQFNPRVNPNELSYIFAGEDAVKILVEFDKENSCLRTAGDILISRLD